MLFSDLFSFVYSPMVNVTLYSMIVKSVCIIFLWVETTSDIFTSDEAMNENHNFWWSLSEIIITWFTFGIVNFLLCVNLICKQQLFIKCQEMHKILLNVWHCDVTLITLHIFQSVSMFQECWTSCQTGIGVKYLEHKV